MSSTPFRLVSKIRAPYGGVYAWKDPMLPHSRHLDAPTWDILVERARSQRYANSIPCGLEFEDELENALCRDYPSECESADPNRVRPRRLTLGDVMTGTEVMATHILAGSPFVDQAEADRRARICSGCARNGTFARPCKGCPNLYALVNRYIGERKTPYDEELKACEICGCSTRAAVWFDLAIQRQPLTEFQRQQFRTQAKEMASIGHEPCWKAFD